MSLQTSYSFTLPRGYVDHHGAVHSTGVMRLATARDELEPLRDPTIAGPDDPRLTILVLARVVETLGSLELVTPHEIESLFAADLAYLQDFYGVINFGTQAEYEQFTAASSVGLVTGDAPAAPQPEPAAATPAESPAASEPVEAPITQVRPGRSAIEEIPKSTV